MSRQSELAALARVVDTGALSNRNWVINGSFNVAQRGTSQTASGYGSVDRWYLYSSGGTYSQETSSPPEGFSHYLKCTGATGSVIFAQAIELPATGNAGVFYNGQTITLSYYAKSTVAGDALDNPLSFRNSQTSTTNLVSIENDSTNSNVLTTSWAKYSKTYTIGVDVDANNTCLVMQPRTRGAPSGDISITGVQLEVGDTATEFEHRSYGDELLRCMRYYEKDFSQGTAPAAGVAIPDRKTGVAYATTAIGTTINFAVTKRTSPTVVVYRGSSGGSSSSGTILIYTGSWNEISQTGVGRINDRYMNRDYSVTVSNGNAYILQYGFTADAEL
jgi:hypothetical protein